MIVLDTNVLSEAIRPDPAPPVLHWMAAQPNERLFTTAITAVEILYGLATLPLGRRRAALELAVRQMLAEDFAGRVLAFDSLAAEEYARIAVVRRKQGRPIGQFDAQIAAIASSRGAALATRNVADFESCGVDLINPWAA